MPLLFFVLLTITSCRDQGIYRAHKDMPVSVHHLGITQKTIRHSGTDETFTELTHSRPAGKTSNIVPDLTVALSQQSDRQVSSVCGRGMRGDASESPKHFPLPTGGQQTDETVTPHHSATACSDFGPHMNEHKPGQYIRTGQPLMRDKL